MRRVTQSWLLQYRGQILSATPVPKLAISCCPIPSSVSTTNTLLFLYQIYQYEKLAFAKRRHLKGLESDSRWLLCIVNLAITDNKSHGEKRAMMLYGNISDYTND